MENGAGLFPSVWRLGALYVLVYRHNSARLVSTGVEADDGALAPECYLLAQNTAFMPARCEIVEVRNPADAVGLACPRTATKKCSDCGAELCEFHTETCGMCRAVFCPPCLSLHQEQHPKAASADREQHRERKSA